MPIPPAVLEIMAQSFIVLKIPSMESSSIPIKKHEDIAVGYIIGSNILNITAVLCIPALLGGASIEPSQLVRDGGTMLALTILLALFAYGFGKKSEVTRLEGSILLVGWVVYTAYLISNA